LRIAISAASPGDSTVWSKTLRVRDDV